MNRIVSFALVALALVLGTPAPSRAEAPRRATAAAAAAREATPATKGTGRARPKLTGVVNLNQADAETLELLPYVGPTRAVQIVEWRKKHPFKKVDDLVRIKGIGKKTLARMRPFLAVSGATTLAEVDAKEDAAGDADDAQP